MELDSFKTACVKNFTKLTLMAIAALSSTLGLRTELTIILGDIALATWIAIGWVFVMISIVAYYKAKQDVELAKLKYYEENRRVAGFPATSSSYTVAVNNAPKGTAVLLNEDK
jgi:hypothetical protein